MVIAEPPVETGAVHDTTDWALAFAVADTEVGAPGAVAGTTAPEAVDGEPVPAALVAVTVNVYEVPLVRPVTVQLVDAVVQVNEPGEDVTLYPVIDEPPELDGALHDTVTCVLPDVPETAVGAPGTVAGVTAADTAELHPAWLVAFTVNV